MERRKDRKTNTKTQKHRGEFFFSSVSFKRNCLQSKKTSSVIKAISLFQMISNDAKFKMSLIHEKKNTGTNINHFLPATDLSPPTPAECSFHSLISTLQKQGVDSFDILEDFYPINPSKWALEVWLLLSTELKFCPLHWSVYGDYFLQYWVSAQEIFRKLRPTSRRYLNGAIISSMCWSSKHVLGGKPFSDVFLDRDELKWTTLQSWNGIPKSDGNC